MNELLCNRWFRRPANSPGGRLRIGHAQTIFLYLSCFLCKENKIEKSMDVEQGKHEDRKDKEQIKRMTLTT